MASKVDAAAEAARKAAKAAAERARRAAEAAAKAAAQAAKAASAKDKVRKKLHKDEMSTGSGMALKLRAGKELPKAEPMRARKTGKFRPGDIALAQKRFAEGDDDEVSAATRSGASKPADDSPPTAEEQAALDSRQVQKAWDEARAKGGNDAAAAQAAAQKLESLTQAHAGDRVYANALVRAASPTIERINGAIAKNANGQAFYKGEKDEAAIKNAVKAISQTSHVAGQVATFKIADSLAKKLENRSELENLDDAFYELGDEKKSGDLFNALGARLDAAGKGKAADELRDRHEGFFNDPLGTIGDELGDVVGAVGNAGGAVLGFAGDVGEGALHVATGAANLAVDAARGTVDVLEKGVELTEDAVKDAVTYAAEQGLKLAGELLGAAHGLALKGLDKALGVSKHIDNLEPGDTYKLGGAADVSVGLGAGVSGDINVRRNEDGTYSVSGELDAKVGVKLFEGAFAGAGGKAEFEFDNAEDAKKAALVLAGAGAALVAGPVLAPALVPHPDELGFLSKHVKSLEITGTVGAEVDAEFGVTGALDVGAAASVSATTGYKLEFEDGHPVAMVRVSELEGEGVGGASLGFMKNQLGKDPKFSAFLSGTTVSASGKLTVETAIPIDHTKITDVAAFLASPVLAAFAGTATSTVTLAGEVQAGDKGAQAALQLGDLEGSEVQSIVSKVLRGDFGNIADGVDVTVGGHAAVYDESEGGALRVGVEALGVGFELEAHDQVRHLTHRTSWGEHPPRLRSTSPGPIPD